MLTMITGLMGMNAFNEDKNIDPTNVQVYITATIVAIGFSIAAVQVTILALQTNSHGVNRGSSFFMFASLNIFIGLGCGAWGYSFGGYNLVTHASSGFLATGLIISYSFLTSKDLVLRTLMTSSFLYDSTNYPSPQPLEGSFQSIK